MRRLSVFNNISLDGFFTDRHNDMSWAHQQDPEWSSFVQENARGESELVYGRITYEMMASFWPTPQAQQMMPEVAKGINESPKVVFSRTLLKATWSNTRLIQSDIASSMRKLKEEPGPDMVILGSGSIVSQLAREGLIDEFQLAIHPLVLGEGRTLFEGIPQRLPLQLVQSRSFNNGTLLATYRPKG